MNAKQTQLRKKTIFLYLTTITKRKELLLYKPTEDILQFYIFDTVVEQQLTSGEPHDQRVYCTQQITPCQHVSK